MLNYGKSNYKIKKVLNSNKPIGKLRVSLGENKTSDVYLKEDISYLYKSNDKIPNYNYKIKTIFTLTCTHIIYINVDITKMLL